MKKLLLVVLILHIVAEALVAAGLILAPGQMAPEASIAELNTLTVQGFAVVAMVALAIWLWPNSTNPVALNIGLGVLATFHTAISLAAVVVSSRGAEDVSGYLLHVPFALLFWLLWFQRQRLAD